jgi:hypothetical protein
MLLTRREAICGFGGGLALLAGSRALAEPAYPSRTIKMIVPYPSGGTTDFLGRIVADQLTTGLGATVASSRTNREPARRSAPNRWQGPSPTAIRC